MSVRAKYKLSAVAGEIDEFERLTAAKNFEQALGFWRQNLEQPTLFGLETSLRRANLLERFFPAGLNELPALGNPADQAFVLYSLALTLNLTGGYPSRAIPLYAQHDQIAERINDYQSLSQSLGHHAKALRQVGFFWKSEFVARRGLQVIRKLGDFLREAVNLYWLGMGLAHRGQSVDSEMALQRALRIFQAKFAVQAEGVANAFLAQRALWLEQFDEALNCATRAESIGRKLEADENHRDLHGAVKILTAALRMKGEALVLRGEPAAGEKFLLEALERAQSIEFVEEELPALRALALATKEKSSFGEARRRLQQTWHLAERGCFALYNADSHNILARVELAENNHEEAVKAAQKAYHLAWCDGPPFAYLRGCEDAARLLTELDAEIPDLPLFNPEKLELIPNVEINPPDEFSN